MLRRLIQMAGLGMGKPVDARNDERITSSPLIDCFSLFLSLCIWKWSWSVRIRLYNFKSEFYNRDYNIVRIGLRDCLEAFYNDSVAVLLFTSFCLIVFSVFINVSCRILSAWFLICGGMVTIKKIYDASWRIFNANSNSFVMFHILMIIILMVRYQNLIKAHFFLLPEQKKILYTIKHK